MVTYDRMPLTSFSKIDDFIGEDYSGNFLLKYNDSRFVNVAAIVDNVNYLNQEIQNLITSSTSNEVQLLKEEIENLKQEKYELSQRLDRLEMLLGDN
jgi:uncharacterized protein YdcH (DUF465 family)